MALHKFLFCGIAVLTLAGCAGGPKYSALPKSEATLGKVVDGSAIAFQGKAPGCASMTLSLAPEVEPGKFGKTEKLGLGFTRLAIPTSWSFYGDGKTLHRYELAPGHYVVAHLSCANSSSSMTTPSGRAVKYGEFDVVAGQTTYIGNITAGTNQSSSSFTFRVKDDSVSAQAAFDKKYPKKAGTLKIGLMDSVLDTEKALRTILELLQQRRETGSTSK